MLMEKNCLFHCIYVCVEWKIFRNFQITTSDSFDYPVETDENSGYFISTFAFNNDELNIILICQTYEMMLDI